MRATVVLHRYRQALQQEAELFDANAEALNEAFPGESAEPYRAYSASFPLHSSRLIALGCAQLSAEAATAEVADNHPDGNIAVMPEQKIASKALMKFMPLLLAIGGVSLEDDVIEGSFAGDSVDAPSSLETDYIRVLQRIEEEDFKDGEPIHVYHNEFKEPLALQVGDAPALIIPGLKLGELTLSSKMFAGLHPDMRSDPSGSHESLHTYMVDSERALPVNPVRQSAWAHADGVRRAFYAIENTAGSSRYNQQLGQLLSVYSGYDFQQAAVRAIDIYSAA